MKQQMAQQDFDTMAQTLEQLSPTEKLVLIERLARSLRVVPQEGALDQQHETLRRLRQELAALPVANPADGFSNRDHDCILYGGV
jgi:hypothetical protein